MNRSQEHVLAQQAFAESKPGTNGWYRATCPICILRRGTPDKRSSWGYNPENGRWRCFRCNAWGSLGGSETARDYRPDKIEEEAKEVVELTEAQRLPQGFTLLADTRDDPDNPFDPFVSARHHLRNRGVTRRVAREANIGATVTDKKFRNRIIMPVYGVADDLAGYIGRSFEPKPWLPYLYPKDMPRGVMFYNHRAIFVETDEPLLLGEGGYDALPYWPDGIAAMGKPTDDHIDILLGAKRPIAVCLDGDAWNEGMWIAERLRFDGARVGHVRIPPREDPNSINPNWLRERARLCIN